jgi:hypothetical protein
MDRRDSHLFGDQILAPADTSPPRLEDSIASAALRDPELAQRA